MFLLPETRKMIPFIIQEEFHKFLTNADFYTIRKIVLQTSLSWAKPSISEHIYFLRPNKCNINHQGNFIFVSFILIYVLLQNNEFHYDISIYIYILHSFLYLFITLIVCQNCSAECLYEELYSLIEFCYVTQHYIIPHISSSF